MDEDNFHLKKEITWGHVVTTIFLVGAMIGLYTDNISQHQLADKRISVLETRLSAEHEQSVIGRREMQNSLQAITNKLDTLNGRLFDRMNK